jgi:hypothetical protein
MIGSCCGWDGVIDFQLMNNGRAQRVLCKKLM